MTGFEEFARGEVNSLIPGYKALKLSASVSDTSYSVEFFVTIDGVERQCYSLADEGVIDEDALYASVRKMAGFIRNSGEYAKGRLNEVSFGFEEESLP